MQTPGKIGDIEYLQVLNPGIEMITASQQAEKREQLAKYTPQMLKDLTVPGLRRLAAGIVPNATKLKKPQLIEELITATKAERTLAVLIPEIPLETIEVNQPIIIDCSQDLTEWTQGLYKEFRALVQSHWHDGVWDQGIHGDIAGLAYRVIRFLDERRGEQESGNLAMTTKLRYRTHICNLLTELVAAEKETVYFTQLQSCLEMLLRQIKIQISDLTAEKKGLQERQLAKRKKEKETISFKPLYEFALNTLNRLEQLKPSDWKKVSISLAITTGRRLAEIHLASTTFEYVDNQNVSFTGQLKVKGSAFDYFQKEPSYKIPVLVNANLVVNAHQWLKANEKVIDTPKAVNTRYSGDLSDAMKVFKKRLGIQHEFFTYKGLRTIYAQVCHQIFNNNDSDNILYLAQILGHGRGELINKQSEMIPGANLTDMLTPQSYNSDFQVVDTECVLP